MSILLHPVSQRHLDAIRGDLPQSMLLVGEPGVGLLSVARDLAGKNLGLVLQPHNSKGDIDLQGGTITVEKIRELYDDTRTREVNRQIIILDNAERMSSGAQAAFLKLLEEPNQNIHFILTSHAPEELLLTIHSRVQQIVLLPITIEQTNTLFDGLGVVDAIKRARLQFIAGGLPAEIIRLTSDQEYFERKAKVMTDARQFLQSTAYERLLVIQNYQASRQEALQLVEGALLIARRSLSQKPQATLLKQLEKLLDAHAKITANHNTRLQLARCAL